MVDVQADSHPGQHSARPAIVIGALGVVFGDIGTSPIYTLQTVFNPGDPASRARSPATTSSASSR